MANFSGVVPDSIDDDIKSYILSQTTEIVDDKNAINIGNNYIYQSDYISTFPIQFALVDDLSTLPDLLNTDSPLFQNYSQAFCEDVSFYRISLKLYRPGPFNCINVSLAYIFVLS